MKRTDVATLPLAYGKAPRWLVFRIQKHATEIAKIMLDKYGVDLF